MRKYKIRKQLTIFLLLCLCVTGVMMMRTTPVQAANVVTEVEQVGESETTITMEFEGIFRNHVQYYYRYNTSTALNGSGVYPLGTNRTVFTILKLKTGTTYYLQIGTKLSETSSIQWSKTFTATTKPAEVQSYTIRQTAETNTSITFKWKAAAGATEYKVYCMNTAESEEGLDPSECKVVKNTTATFQNLKPGDCCSVAVEPYRKIGSYVTKNKRANPGLGGLMVTRPGKVSNIYCNYFNHGKLSYLHLNYSMPIAGPVNYYEGSEERVYDLNNKLLMRKKGGKKIGNVPNTQDKNTFYKVKIRQYYYNYGTKRTSYGDWKDFYVALTNTVGAKVKKVDGKLKISWKKTKGATGYKILMGKQYFGDPDPEMDYTQVGKTTKTSLVVNQKLEGRTSYYIKIFPYKTVKGKTYIATDAADKPISYHNLRN